MQLFVERVDGDKLLVRANPAQLVDFSSQPIRIVRAHHEEHQPNGARLVPYFLISSVLSVTTQNTCVDFYPATRFGDVIGNGIRAHISDEARSHHQLVSLVSMVRYLGALVFGESVSIFDASQSGQSLVTPLPTNLEKFESAYPLIASTAQVIDMTALMGRILPCEPNLSISGEGDSTVVDDRRRKAVHTRIAGDPLSSPRMDRRARKIVLDE